VSASGTVRGEQTALRPPAFLVPQADRPLGLAQVLGEGRAAIAPLQVSRDAWSDAGRRAGGASSTSKSSAPIGASTAAAPRERVLDPDRRPGPSRAGRTRL
jgi:hypothetical protein